MFFSSTMLFLRYHLIKTIFKPQECKDFSRKNVSVLTARNLKRTKRMVSDETDFSNKNKIKRQASKTKYND